MDDQVAPPPDTPSPGTGANTEQSEQAVGPDPLASLEHDNSAFVLGIVPVVVMGVLVLGFIGLYFHRRRKNWNDLDEALRIDGGDTPIGSAGSHFTTKDLQEMDPTRPSERMSEIKD